MTSITQDMKFRQSLMKYSRKYGVIRASRKYNKARSYIYFWLNRWDGTIQSLATQSKRPHHHPNEHTPEEIALIRRFRKRNPQLEVTELWHRLDYGWGSSTGIWYCMMDLINNRHQYVQTVCGR